MNKLLRWLASPWSKRTENRLLWGAIAVAIPLGYLMLSGLCAIGTDCTLANGDFFLWLFGR